MTDVKAIVYATDFSELSIASIPWAKRMAELQGAKLHCVYAVQEPTSYGPFEGAAVLLPTGKELKEAASKQLEEFVSTHFADVADVSSSVSIGSPASEIVRYADECGASMIVMSTHGYTGLKHALLGSTAEAVLRHAKCPVLAVPVK